MARLIEADKLKQHYAWWANGSEEHKRFKEMFDTIINLQPTVEAVDVVRCKSCKWLNDFGCAIRIADKSDKPREDDFCSFGERKTKGD